MLISKINAYSNVTSNYQNKKTNFKGTSYPPKDYIYSNDLFKKATYRSILTYNEISALKNITDKLQNSGINSNVAVAFYSDAVGDVIYAGSQEDLISKQGKWLNITDYDAA